MHSGSNLTWLADELSCTRANNVVCAAGGELCNSYVHTQATVLTHLPLFNCVRTRMQPASPGVDRLLYLSFSNSARFSPTWRIMCSDVLYAYCCLVFVLSRSGSDVRRPAVSGGVWRARQAARHSVQRDGQSSSRLWILQGRRTDLIVGRCPPADDVC
jgi:hypothetical protein